MKTSRVCNDDDDDGACLGIHSFDGSDEMGGRGLPFGRSERVRVRCISNRLETLRLRVKI